MKKILSGFFLISLLLSSSLWGKSTAIKDVVSNENQKNAIVEIRYPQGFSDLQVDNIIKNFIKQSQDKFERELNKASNLSPDLPGKNSLSINYKIAYQDKRVLSILFTTSTYFRGAAHPNTTTQTFNFIEGKPIQLYNLFDNQDDALNKIVEYSRKKLLAKNISDPSWVNKGTKPTLSNYNNWYFSANGLVIVFDSYQVAAYAYGAQEVIIPLSLIKNSIKPDIVKSVWGR